ncbi:MAG: ABC transporter permease [Solirubrobacteraceae bacterium]
MSKLQRVGLQLRADLRIFVRNPAAVFFTAILPVLFLCMFVAIFGNQRNADGVRAATQQVPGFIGLAVVSASFVALAIGLTSAREDGVLKRIRGTAAPPWLIFAGRIGTSIASATIVTAMLLAIGAIAFGVRIPTTTMPGLITALVLGVFAFCGLGIAFTRAIPSQDAAPAMTNAVVLPLYFISGVFLPAGQLPSGLVTVADLLPVKPFIDALIVAFDPRTTGAGIAGGDLAVLAGWGLVGLVFAVRFFAWTPRHQAE